MGFKIRFITLFISVLWFLTTSTHATLTGATCQDTKLVTGNGTQNPDGTCVITQLGEIPTKNNMISTLILSPQNGQTITANQPFNVTTKTTGLNTGFFADAAKQYYTLSQSLGENGLINGHIHITIQLISGNNPPDPQLTAFFKGINDKADGSGNLAVQVPNGIPPGQYRICTMVSSESHQCVLMPVAVRGSQDDCIRIESK
ncbi:16619_t:CDS:1 [Cetraspora pellucida]|uniref:16619_t:CDS:1 n=1 Tax=Cetraspora pellucida TaxID=1433469 RepID=A0A9N9I7D6_9GLOM|nr:16619_t:CDS:1 [Cetraspora pellucida]